MEPYVPQTTARRRRTERNADAYAAHVPAASASLQADSQRHGDQPPAEPSMQAPQPMPFASRNAAPASTPVRQTQPAAPSGPQRPVMQQTPAFQQPGMQGMYSSHGQYVQQQPRRASGPSTQGMQQSQPFPPQGYGQPPYQQPYGQMQQMPVSHVQPAAPASMPPAQGYQAPQGHWTPVQPQQEQPASQQNSQARYQSPQNGWQPPAYPAQGKPKSSGTSQGGGQPPKRPAPGLLILALFLIVGGILGGAVALGRSAAENNALKDAVTAYDSLFCQGVYVDGIHLGGMTQEQARQAVIANAQQKRDQWSVQLTYQGGLVRSVSADDLGMSVHVDSALNAAWQQGHQSNDLAERKAAMDALLVTPYNGYTALPSGNTSAIDRILQELASQVHLDPSDAQLTGFDPLLTYPFTIKESVTGRRLNVGPTKERLYAMAQNMESGSIELELLETQPQVTTAALQSKLTLRGTAYTQISTTSTENRTNNIRRAFELISGTVLKPGESFSFNGVVGPRTAKNGFFEAIEYAYNEERMGYGGGICQASSTIYIAAVRANLDIVKREPHSDKVNYTEYGLDATVYYDGKKIDLVFKNNTGSNIYIKSSVQRDPKISKNHYLAVVEIWGESLGEGISYDLIAETVEVLPAPIDPEYRDDKKGEYVTYIDEEHIYREAKEGYKVDSFKVKYVNGQEVDRTFLYEDTYNPKTQVIYTGIKEREDLWLVP